MSDAANKYAALPRALQFICDQRLGALERMLEKTEVTPKELAIRFVSILADKPEPHEMAAMVMYLGAIIEISLKDVSKETFLRQMREMFVEKMDEHKNDPVLQFLSRLVAR